MAAEKRPAPNRSKGLLLAVNKVGGYRELARRLGIAQQALAKWSEIPANRLVQVETVTGIPREILRPELYRHSDLARLTEMGTVHR